MSSRCRTIALVAVLSLLAACGQVDDVTGTVVDETPDATVAEETPEPDGEGDDPADGETVEPEPDPCADPPADEDHIFVTEPGSGDEVSTTFTVEGCSSTYEANVIWELLDADGRVLADGFAMGGTMGQSGDLEFEVTYDLDERQDGLLRVHGEDPRDGSEAYLNEIELVLIP